MRIITLHSPHGRELRAGEPCGHPGCLSHVSHPCEGCGRIAGYPVGEDNARKMRRTAFFVRTPSGPDAHDDQAMGAAMAGLAASSPEENPYSDVTTGTCGKCHKTPEEHYKDKQGTLWCVGNVNEAYKPIPIYYPKECKGGKQ
jgi:hypothetical protein